jgi:hypothetical protein
MAKKITIILLLITAVGAFVFYKIYNKPHEDINDAEADFFMDATALYAAFSTDETAANQQYLNKIIAVTGTVAETSTNLEEGISVLLKSDDLLFGVRCELDQLSQHKRLSFETGEKITLKGICSGFLNDVVIVRCLEQ